MSINKSIIKSTYLISSGTVISRILGFIRDIVIAGIFGTSFAAEAFVVAFRIPNLFRSLVGEGAVNAAVVPVIIDGAFNDRVKPEISNDGTFEIIKNYNDYDNKIKYDVGVGSSETVQRNKVFKFVNSDNTDWLFVIDTDEFSSI